MEEPGGFSVESWTEGDKCRANGGMMKGLAVDVHSRRDNGKTN